MKLLGRLDAAELAKYQKFVDQVIGSGCKSPKALANTRFERACSSISSTSSSNYYRADLNWKGWE